MHGLMLRPLQGYLKETFGPAAWTQITRAADVSVDTFEPMLRYDPTLVTRITEAASRILSRPVDAVWEDLGTYLVTNPGYEGVRRLLRFGGVNFAEFLHSLEQLPGRAQLAMPELEVPELILQELDREWFLLTCRFPIRGAALVILGMLRAMADDYGALVVIELDSGPQEDVMTIHLLDASHATARPFQLTVQDR